MLVMSLWSLVLLVKPFLSGSTGLDSLLSAVLGLILLLLSLFLLAETARVLRRRKGRPEAGAAARTSPEAPAAGGERNLQTGGVVVS